MLNRNDLANPHLLGENRLPARTLLLPAQKKGVTHKNYTESAATIPSDSTGRVFPQKKRPPDALQD